MTDTFDTAIPPGTVTRIGQNFEDARGTISDVLVGEPIDAVTIITTRRGAVRGNHYHNETVQWMYLLSGRMRMTTRMPGERAHRFEVSAGDLVLTRAVEHHAMRALDDTTFVVLTRGARAGSDYESDTYRLADDQILERSTEDV